jgi:hypothetical protein
MAISIIGTNRTSAGTISTPRSWTQMSLAQCIYDFLVTVREFRLIPRRKELLQVRKPPRVTSIQKGQQRPV